MPVVDPKEQSVGITTAQNQETINPNGTLSGEIEIQTLDQPSEELMNAWSIHIVSIGLMIKLHAYIQEKEADQTERELGNPFFIVLN